MSPKKIADSTISGKTDGSWILCRDTNIVRSIQVALGFVFALVGIGAPPVAYAEPIPAQCPEHGTEFAPGGGGEARWEKCVKEGTTNIRVTVTDTLIDGKCAEVLIDFRNGTPLQGHFACDGHPPNSRNYRERADDATVWVQLKMV